MKFTTSSYPRAPEEQKPRLLTGIQAAAEYLGVSTVAMKQFISADLIQYIKIDRQYYFRENWLDEIVPTNPNHNQSGS